MEFRVLGPVEVWHAGRPLNLGPAKQLVLMAKLLKHANQVVSASQLIEALWGEALPETAPAILHTYVSRLRRALRPAGGEILLTRPPGYLLRVEEGQLDLDRFESLVAAARIDADLCLGRHRDLIGELTTLVADHPLRERLHAQLMVALYRSGRPADALASYRRLRQMLIDELGLEPGSALQRLQQAILLADPSLGPAEPRLLAGVTQTAVPPAGAGVSAPEAVVSPPTVRPRQLPPDTAWFTGREQELAQLERLLGQTAPEVPMVIVAINGLAGVGKSALATRAAHRLAPRFPDGQLYVDLHGAADLAPLHPNEVLGRFLRAFGVDGRHLPADPEERAGLLRSLLAERRVLAVLD